MEGAATSLLAVVAGQPAPVTMEVHVGEVLRNMKNPSVNLRHVLAEFM